MNFIKAMALAAAVGGMLGLAACATNTGPVVIKSPPPGYKQQVVELLKSIETGDSRALGYINPDKYIQHNLEAADGLPGLKAMLASLPKAAVKVNTVRVYQDGNFVFAHTDYDFPVAKVGFDVFRFEDGKIVEHWDNLQQKATKANQSGHTMLDGPTFSADIDKTAANKALIQNYMNDLLAGRREKFSSYFDGISYIQHSPQIADNLTGLFAGLQAMAKQGQAVHYDKVRMVLGEGNFVLVMAEGSLGGKPASYYDLYRIREGKIAEHWDTIEVIAPRAEWKNPNGKF